MTLQKHFDKQGWTPNLLDDLSDKTYVVTGASAGAGLEASRILLSKGANVVMLNRSAEKTQTVLDALKFEFGEDVKASFIRMDLGNLRSVRDAAEDVLKKIPKIDALICNAAIAQVGKQELTVDGFESQLGVNHYGHFLLCGLLFERVEDSHGRIVVVGSEGYKMGIKTIQFDDMNWDKNYNPNSTYCHSKLAQIMFAYELQDRISAAGKNVGVYVCHPGASRTSLINEKATPVSRVLFSMMAASPLVQSAEKGAYPEVLCATYDGLNQKAYYGPSGRWNWVGPVDQCNIEPFVYDKPIAEKLWKLSEEQTGFRWAL